MTEVAERRYVTLDGAEVRESGDGLSFTGYASVFDHEYPITDWRGSYTEVIRPGAFKRSLANAADVPLLIGHEGTPLARTKSGTLVLSEDSRGLHVEAPHLDPANPDVQRLRSAMSRGDMDEMSFAFRIPKDGDAWSERGDGQLREVREANIHKGDVSVVTFGANQLSGAAAMRSVERALMSFSDDEAEEMFRALAARYFVTVGDDEFEGRLAALTAEADALAAADAEREQRRARMKKLLAR
jgi:HK97 family phage prohead protease